MQENLDAHQEAEKGWENRKAILLLFLANFVSGIAQGISMIAIPWYFVQQGDTVLFGYLYAGITAVSLIWGPFSGTLVDKYDRRKIFLVLNITLGIVLLLVSFYGFQNDGVPWLMVGFVYLMTFLNYNLHYPNLYAFVQEITEKRFYGKITSYLEIQGQLASVLAGASAALLLEGTENGMLSLFGVDIHLGGDIAAWDIHHIFLMDGLTYFVGFLIIYMIRYRALVPRKVETGGTWQRMKAGYHFLMENKSIFIFGVASYSIFMCVLVVIFYTNPIYVEKHLQEGGDIFASSEICYALGAIFSGAAIRYIFNEKYVSIPMSIIIMTFVTAILFLILNFSNNIPLFFLMIFILGITNAGTRIQRVTYLFRRIPNQYYGRAGSIFFISNIIFRVTLVSIFALPFFQTGNNIIYSMGILSAFLFISGGLLIFFYKRFR